MGKFYAPPPINYEATRANIDQKISPSILLIIIILAIIFSISAVLHLLLRYFSLKRTTQNNQQDEHGDDVTALQGQLRQLFHLHDAGVDQLYIDTLPVFPYKAIIGVKDPFDCAVCLCEFELNDKLRLLPKCSHAFHMECIDTWLLSHSTCPLCRLNIVANLNEFESVGYRNLPPFVCVLESGSVENSREIQEMITSGGNGQFGSGHFEFGRKSVENRGHHEEKNNNNVVVIKLGKFKNLDGDQNVGPSEDNYSTNNNDGQNGENELGHDSRRCYSMGSFAYVLDEKTSLQVPVNTLMKKQVSKRTIHRVAMSEYGLDFDGTLSFQNGNGGNNNKRESYSTSKIWQRNGNKKEINNECSSTRTISEIQVEIDEDIQSCYSIDSISNQNVGSTSTHRRTLAWLMGKPNKVFHNHSSSVSSNV